MIGGISQKVIFDEYSVYIIQCEAYSALHVTNIGGVTLLANFPFETLAQTEHSTHFMVVICLKSINISLKKVICQFPHLKCAIMNTMMMISDERVEQREEFHR